MAILLSRQRSARSREPLAAQAARRIRADITNGYYGLGQRLTEADIARRYGINRNAVREALQVLEGEGLVTNEPFCGRSVCHPTQKQIEGSFLLRITLETVAASLAAYRITPEQSAQLRRLANAPPEGFTQADDLNEWDIAFHLRIWQIADEPELTSQIERLIRPFMLLARKPEEDLAAEVAACTNPNDSRSHAQLLEAICAQDPTLARSAMFAHLSTPEQCSREMRDLLAATLGLTRPVSGVFG